MTREQIEELAALASLGALDGDDLVAWNDLTAADPQAASLEAEFSDSLACLLGNAPAAAAPIALRGRVMDAIFGSPPAIAPNHAWAWRSWAAAAAIVLLAVTSSVAISGQRETVVVRDARPDAQQLFVPLTGYGEYADVKACVLWDSGQRGWYVQTAGLPALPTGYGYRIWAVNAEGDIYDCGELPQAADRTSRRFVYPAGDIESMKGFAVSIEPAGTTPGGLSTPAILISGELRG